MASERRRLAGIDLDTVAPALLVLALALLLSVVLPWVNSDAPYQHPVRKGDVAELASGITLVPTAGWDLATGALVGHARSPVGDTATTELVNGGLDFYAETAPFAGTPAALLRRVNSISSKLHHARGSGTATHRYPVSTRQGAVGVGQDFVGINREGSVVAFVFPARGRAAGEGVEVVVSGPKATMSRARHDIVGMIRSIRAGS